MTGTELSREDLATLCQGLAWDVPAGAISWHEHREFVIDRVLARGRLDLPRAEVDDWLADSARQAWDGR